MRVPPITVSREQSEQATWRERAACTGVIDPEIFFPALTRGTEGGTLVSNAKAVCRFCSVSQACLTEALSRGESHGIWGGSTPAERRALIRKTRQQDRPSAADRRG